MLETLAIWLCHDVLATFLIRKDVPLEALQIDRIKIERKSGPER
jgi:hypothetical protein